MGIRWLSKSFALETMRLVRRRSGRSYIHRVRHGGMRETFASPGGMRQRIKSAFFRRLLAICALVGDARIEFFSFAGSFSRNGKAFSVAVFNRLRDIKKKVR